MSYYCETKNSYLINAFGCKLFTKQLSSLHNNAYFMCIVLTKL